MRDKLDKQDFWALMLHNLLLGQNKGSIDECIRKLSVYEGTPHIKSFMLYLLTELSDIVTQSIKMAEILGVSDQALLDMGIRRYEEKKKEFLKRHPGAVWV